MRRAIRNSIAGAGLSACAAFAIWPAKPTAFETPTIARTDTTPKKIAALDLAAFRAPIWVAEPPPPTSAAAAPAPPPPPPLKIQLLAIIQEAGAPVGMVVYKAAVYDHDTDRILVVAAGERLGLRTVEQVDRSSLTLRDETGKRVLALKEGTP